MKFSYCCPKCQNSDIAIIEGGAFKGNVYNTLNFGFSTIYLTRYVCIKCGFTENYVNNEKDLEKIKDKFLRPNQSSDFV